VWLKLRSSPIKRDVRQGARSVDWPCSCEKDANTLSDVPRKNLDLSVAL
jgi:hypothetical protein